MRACKASRFACNAISFGWFFESENIYHNKFAWAAFTPINRKAKFCQVIDNNRLGLINRGSNITKATQLQYHAHTHTHTHISRLKASDSLFAAAIFLIYCIESGEMLMYIVHGSFGRSANFSSWEFKKEQNYFAILMNCWI